MRYQITPGLLEPDSRPDMPHSIPENTAMTPVAARHDINLWLRTEEFRLAQLSAGVVTWSFDPQNREARWGEGMHTLLGLPETVPPSYAAFVDQIHRDDVDSVLSALADAETSGNYNVEFRIIRPDGAIRWLAGRASAVRDDTGVVTQILGANFDITDRRATMEELAGLKTDLERQVAERTEALVQAQKTESIGRLTGGIAHDFNNLLGVVLGNLQLVQQNPQRGDAAALIDGARSAAQRGAVLTQRLLAFARRQPLQQSAVRVADMLAAIEPLIERAIGPEIALSIDSTGAADAVVRCDVAQMEMALLNLAINARDAMAAKGAITIDCARALMEGAPAIVISMTDDGSGMAADVLQRATEPFFTTKGVGKGTGLGLSMVQGLMAQSGGRLAIDSTVGSGTTIALWLPESYDAIAAVQPPLVATPQPLRAGTTILLVDDDALVLMGSSAVLADMGAVVMEANSGFEAIQVLESGCHIDAIVTDHAMPGMSGLELAKTVAARWPGLPLIIASGYAELPGDDAGLWCARLAKPYSQEELAHALERAFA
jgi:PAS domain S-box-containing protein